jgi:hypothetical protein
MKAQDYTRIFAQLVMDWAPGTKVWHRASGKRGLVIGWEVREQGNAFVVTDYGSGACADYPLCLSLCPVPEGGDGESWKEGAGV